jgi:uncharacterized protein with HEPN domain
VRNVRERLLDVLEAIERIERHAAKGPEAFEQDELIQTWMLHHLRIVGESCRAVPTAFSDAHPEIPWSKITGFRNILVHDYFGIHLDVVWLIVERDLPTSSARSRPSCRSWAARASDLGKPGGAG